MKKQWVKQQTLTFSLLSAAAAAALRADDAIFDSPNLFCLIVQSNERAEQWIIHHATESETLLTAFTEDELCVNLIT